MRDLTTIQGTVANLLATNMDKLPQDPKKLRAAVNELLLGSHVKDAKAAYDILNQPKMKSDSLYLATLTSYITGKKVNG